MNSYFISYEVVLIDGNINKPTRKGWFTANATLEQIKDFNFCTNCVITNIKNCGDRDLDLEKESIIFLNISKLN